MPARSASGGTGRRAASHASTSRRVIGGATPRRSPAPAPGRGPAWRGHPPPPRQNAGGPPPSPPLKTEERRVGEEGRTPGGADHLKKKKNVYKTRLAFVNRQSGWCASSGFMSVY